MRQQHFGAADLERRSTAKAVTSWRLTAVTAALPGSNMARSGIQVGPLAAYFSQADKERLGALAAGAGVVAHDGTRCTLDLVKLPAAMVLSPVRMLSIPRAVSRYATGARKASEVTIFSSWSYAAAGRSRSQASSRAHGPPDRIGPVPSVMNVAPGPTEVSTRPLCFGSTSERGI